MDYACFWQILMRQSILLVYFLCDKVQGVERFAAHPRHFPSQIPPRTLSREEMFLKIVCVVAKALGHIPHKEYDIYVSYFLPGQQCVSQRPVASFLGLEGKFVIMSLLEILFT